MYLDLNCFLYVLSLSFYLKYLLDIHHRNRVNCHKLLIYSFLFFNCNKALFLNCSFLFKILNLLLFYLIYLNLFFSISISKFSTTSISLFLSFGVCIFTFLISCVFHDFEIALDSSIKYY